MQLIRINNGAYDRYEKLLLKRDQLEKDAAQILISYTKEFGDLLTESFEARIACIRLKKEIAWCQAQLNRDTKIDADAMKREIDTIMAAYYRELADMYAETKAAKGCERISEVTLIAVKRIYRKLAKQLHPDINPMTAKEPQLSELWNRISIAYNANDLEELRELEVLAAAALEQAGGGRIEVAIPDIEKKILHLEAQISEIVRTEPYTLRDILDDPAAMEAKKEELKKERDTYLQYKEELKGVLEDLLQSGGGHVTWRMN